MLEISCALSFISRKGRKKRPATHHATATATQTATSATRAAPTANWRPLNWGPVIGGMPFGCAVTEVEPLRISNPETPSTTITKAPISPV